MFIRLLVAVLLLTGVSACLPETRHSIITRPEQIDPDLEGMWLRSTDEMVMLLQIAREEADDRVARVAYVIVHPGEPDIDVQRSVLHARLTRIGSATYFEAVPTGPDPFPYKKFRVDRFFGRLKLASALTLYIEFPDTDLLEDAIRKGELSGRMERRDDAPVVSLTSPTNQLRAFLARGVPASEYSQLVFRKLTPGDR